MLPGTAATLRGLAAHSDACDLIEKPVHRVQRVLLFSVAEGEFPADTCAGARLRGLLCSGLSGRQAPGNPFFRRSSRNFGPRDGPLEIPSDTLPTGPDRSRARLKLGPRLHPSAFVVPNATVVGDVTLHEESNVWYGAVLRGDINRIVIGPRSNIQDNAVIHLADAFGVRGRARDGRPQRRHSCMHDRR